jgi:hypothetical protein
MMKIRYKDYTVSMKALFWGSGVLILINIICLILTWIPGIMPGGQLLIGSAISLVLTVIILILLTVKRGKMNKEEK